MDYSLQQLKDIATELNIDFHPSISAIKLAERIEEYATEKGTTLDELSSLSFTNIKKENTMEPDTAVKETKTIPPNVSLEEIERLKNLTFAGIATDNAKKSEAQQIRDAKKLVRVIITCNHKNKSSYQGDILSVNNSIINETKFVPFGVPTHVTKMMLNYIKEKKCQMFRKIKHSNGFVETKPYQINEYNVQELPPITKEELEAIKKKQLAEGYTGE